MMETEERNNVAPVCPHCSREMGVVCYRKMRSFFGKCYIYFCPHCHKTLGVTHRKGIWTN